MSLNRTDRLILLISCVISVLSFVETTPLYRALRFEYRSIRMADSIGFGLIATVVVGVLLIRYKWQVCRWISPILLLLSYILLLIAKGYTFVILSG